MLVVQLRRIGPAREIRVAPEGDHALPVAGFRAEEKLGLFPVLLRPPLDIVLGMLRDPVVIARSMVAHKIQHQPKAPLAQPRAEPFQPRIPAQRRRHMIGLDSIRRALDVLCREVGQ